MIGYRLGDYLNFGPHLLRMFWEKELKLDKKTEQEVLDSIEFLKMKKLKKEPVEQSLLLIQQESLRRIWDSKDEDLYEI